MSKLRIIKGDRVKVISGSNKGKIGKVLRVLLKEKKVVVSGVNLVKKHTKPSKTSEGGIITKELPINISNVGYIDSSANMVTKIGYKIDEKGKKVRFEKRSNLIIKKG